MNPWPTIRAIPDKVLALLDWFVKAAERLIVLGITSSVFYVGYQLWRGSLLQKERDAVTFVAENWKIAFILLIPLFYQTVRTFLEEVQEAWGMNRPKSGEKKKDETSPDATESESILPLGEE